MKRPAADILQAECDRFMREHAIGDTIRVWVEADLCSRCAEAARA